MKKTIFFLFIFFSLVYAAYAQESTQKIKVACVGNSITFGSGIEDKENNSYPAILALMLGENYEVKNSGMSGRTLLMKGDSPYMKQKIFRETLEFNPDIIVIKLGSNDSKPRNWQYGDEYEHDLDSLVNVFSNLPAKPEIYLCYPATSYENRFTISDSVIVHGIIPVIDRVAEKHNLKIIDLHNPTANPSLLPDGVHPSGEGAKVMAKVVYEAITQKE